jgi:oligoribonuclease
MSSTKTLGSRTRPLVWIDVETTGLDPKKDKILEIAVCLDLFSTHWTLTGVYQVLITDGNLELVDSGIQYVVKRNQQTLDK